MQIIFYRNYEDHGCKICPRIRRAPRERGWMDETNGKFAYRCLPLAIANQHGWEVFFESKISVVWSGGNTEDDVKVISSNHNFVQSMFGSGIVSFHIGHIVKLSPGHDLYITGSPNHIKAGIQPLTGIVEASWSPYTFTMNWKITEPNRIIEFQPGEPFCFFFPIRRQQVEEAEVVLRSISDDPSLAREAALFGLKREEFIKRTKEGIELGGWQRDYFQGKLPSGGVDTCGDGHRTKLRLRLKDETKE